MKRQAEGLPWWSIRKTKTKTKTKQNKTKHSARNFALLTHNLSSYPISVASKSHMNLGIHMHGMYEKLSSAAW